MKRTIKLALLVLLACFSLKTYAQPAVYLYLEDLPTGCGLGSGFSFNDLEWYVTKANYKDGGGNLVQVGGDVIKDITVDDIMGDGRQGVQINLDPMNSKNAFQPGEVVTISVSIKSTASCGSGWKGTMSATYDGSGIVYTDGDMTFRLSMSGEAPKISVGGDLCAGGATTNITIDNVSDYTGYSIKVYDGANDVTSKFTIGTPLGATTTIAANTGTTAKGYTVKLVKGSNEYTAALTVKNTPSINLKIPATQNDGSGNGYYCTGGSDKATVLLSVDPISGYTFSWSKDGGPGTGGSNYTASQAGTYKVTATNPSGCPAEAEVKVVTKTAPAAPAITAPTPQDVCVEGGGSTTLSVASPDASYTYTWTGATAGTPTSSATVQNSSVATTAVGSQYTVKAKDAYCTSNSSAAATLKGHKFEITLSPSGSTAVASGVTQTVTATPKPTPVGGANVDPTTWNWTVVAGAAIASGQGTAAITTASITTTSKYKVYAKDEFGCPATSAETEFTIKAGSVWDINLADAKGCTGTTITLSPTTTGATVPTPVTYAWSSSDGLTFASPGSLSTTVSGSPGSYHAKITITDGNGVAKNKEVVVKIYGKPTLTDVSITSAGTVVCKGNTIDLSANGGAASTTVLDLSANLSYKWSSNATAKADDSKATATLAANTNTYSVYVQDGNGCKSDTKTTTRTGHEVTVVATLNGSSANPVSVAYGSIGALDCTPSFNPNSGPEAGSVDPTSYVWTKVSGTAGIDGATNAKTAATEALKGTGTFKIQLKDNFGCPASAEVNYTTTGSALTVTLNPAYICAGSDTKLSCTTSGGDTSMPTYEWISVNGDITFDDPTASQPKVTTTTPGVYRVKVKVKKGVQTVESAEVDITVGAQPKLQSIGIYQGGTLVPNSGSVLPNSKVTVTAVASSLPAGTVYTWVSTPAGLIETTSADQLSVESKPLSLSPSTCFRLTLTNAEAKCPDYKEACVPVAGTEFVINMPNDSLCFGTSKIITSAGRVTGGVKNYVRYTWTCADPNFKYTVSGDQQYITVGANTPVGTYTVNLEVEDKKGNVIDDDFTVKIMPMPVFTALPATPQTSRVGQTVNLSATANPGSTIVNWTPGGPVQGAQTGGTGWAQIVAGAFTGTGSFNYTVEAKLGKCSIDSVIVINVSASVENIEITAGDVTACEGDLNIALSASAKGGSGSLSYRWEVISPTSITLTTTTGPKVYVASASVGSHIVRVHVTDNSAVDPAPAQYKDITVTINAKPTINSIAVDNTTSGASNVTVVDYGDELKLTGNITPNTASCTWTDDRGVLLSPNGNPAYTKPMTDNTQFTLKLTNDKNCSVSQNVTVTVKQPENGALLRLELTKVCAESGRDMLLTMTATGGTTYSFRLRNNAGLDVPFTGAGPWTYNIPLGGQDTYFAQNFQAFKNGVEILPAQVSPKDGIEALFFTTPIITIAGGNTKNVCQGNDLTLSASAQLGNTTFEWNDPTVVNGQPFFPKNSGSYTVTAKTEQGCTATSTVDVTIVPKPTVTINASPGTICLGDTVFLTAGGSATEFTWNNGKTGATIIDVPNVGGTVKYVVSGKETLNGCTDTATVKVIVNEPPVIVSTSRTTRSIAIGKNATFSVKATGKSLRYEWQRWTGSSWLTLYDGDDDQPGVFGSRTDSLTLTNVPRSWNNTKLQCVVSNNCGVADTSFLLYVKECFDILDVEWNMCEGIRPETDPTIAIDGWYCPGTRIAICAKLILDDPDADMRNAVYKWKVDGLSTDDGRWGEMVFISDSSILSWVPPASWQDNITVSLCAYVDGACDTVCKSYLRLKATAYTDLDWRMKTSVDPTRKFCPGDTVVCWIDDPKQTAGLKPTYRWYNDIFDLSHESPTTNEVISLKNDRVVMKLGQKDTWMKVIMTPSPEICTRQGEYADTAFLQVKQIVEPEFSIWSEDTLACANDEIYLEARWKNAGAHPKFQWTRSIGEPYWNLGTQYYAKTVLDENDVWVKCVLTPSDEVCFRQDTVFVDALQIKVIKDPAVVIFADLEHKVQGDEIIIESDITKMPIKDPAYTWYINNRIEPNEKDEEWISSEFKQGDKIQLGVKGTRICQNQIMSNILEIDFNNSARDTLIVIYQGERIHNLDLFRAGDELKEFSIAQGGYTGSGKVSLGLDGRFNYKPDKDFIGMEKVTYVVYNKYTGTIETGHVYIQVKDKDRFFVPNVITPNGDGLNDTWKLDFLTDFPNHKLTIYNRYGKVVFRADHYNNDWDGSGQGNSGYVAYFNLPNGIYTYVIDLGNKEILKGWVEIRKNMNLGRYSR